MSLTARADMFLYTTEENKLTFERYEGNFAVIYDDNGRRTDVDRKLMPDGIKEGDRIESADGGYIISEENEKARERVANLQNSLWK